MRKSILAILLIVNCLGCFGLKADSFIPSVKEENYLNISVFQYNPNYFVVKDNYFYEKTDHDEITIYKIKMPFLKKVISTYQINDSVCLIQNILVENNLMYILYLDSVYNTGWCEHIYCDLSLAIEIVNISIPTNPVFVSKLDIEGIHLFYTGSGLSNDYLYFTFVDWSFSEPLGNSSYYFVNIKNPYQPKIDAIYTITNGTKSDSILKGNTLFTITDESRIIDDIIYGNSNFSIWDITNKTNWIKINYTSSEKINYSKFAMNNNNLTAFYDIFGRSLDLYDFSNLSNLVLINKFYFGEDELLKNVFFWDNYLGIVFDSGFKIFRVDDQITNQSLDGFGFDLKDGGYFYRGVYDDDKVYLSRASYTNKRHIFYVFDVTNPQEIKQLYPMNLTYLAIGLSLTLGMIITVTIIVVVLRKRKRVKIKE
ncbi:MAG: hypothetical protein JXA54_09305 [Candidatus Heimdallarchaeota archaeon]|nr:hypothetical protein [Candidatus Heimdallarchaeota archaeon]